MVQNNRELNEKYWNNIVERLIKTYSNIEVKRYSYIVKRYEGGPLHKLFFICKAASGEYVIGATKKAIVVIARLMLVTSCKQQQCQGKKGLREQSREGDATQRLGYQ